MKIPKNISELQGINPIANQPDTDFTAEALAAGLMEQGYDGEKIHIVRQGDAKRGFSKDMEEVGLHFSEHDLSEYLQIKTNRESVYDALPEGIFHQQAHKKFNRDKEEVLDEIKEHRMEEFYARKFFQVFETEADYMQALACLDERLYDNKVANSNYTDIFIPYWQVLKLLNPEQRVFFMHIIPFLHEIRSNNGEIEDALSILLGASVKITIRKHPEKNADNFFESKLGESRLGIDFVPGKTIDDGQSDVKIIVGPVSAKKMEYFLDTSPGNAVLASLCFLFFPGDAFIEKEFDIFPEDAAFILSDESTNSYLGINTFI